MNKILFILLIIPMYLISNDYLKYKIPEENIDVIEKKYEIILPKEAYKSKDEYLPVFSISCNGIKYTGAYEQVLIDYLEDIKTYVKELIEPYTTLSKMDALIFSYSFGKCMTEEAKKEVTGDETHSSLVDKSIDAIGKSSSDLIIKYGTTFGGGSFSSEIETNVNVDTEGIVSKTVEQSGEEGMYNNVVRCMMKEREDIYLKLYNTLSYSLKMKWITTSAINNQCMVELRKKNEVVPSWAELTGIDYQEYINKISNSIELNSKKDGETQSRTTQFMQEYLEEVLAFEIKSGLDLCVEWDVATNSCIDKVKIERQGCEINENGYMSGGCDCINGVDILTGKSCSLPKDFKLNKLYGQNTIYNYNSVDDISLSEIENIFIETLGSSTYKMDSYYPISFFMDEELILFKWNLYLGDEKGFLNINIKPLNNFDIKTSQINLDNSKVYENLDFNNVLVRDNKGNIIYYSSDFVNKFVLHTAMEFCSSDRCRNQIINNKFIDESNMKNILSNYTIFKTKYEEKIDILNTKTPFQINFYNWKLKLVHQNEALKDMFNISDTYRTVKLKNDFFENWIINTENYAIKMKMENISDKDITNFKNFSRKFIMNMEDLSNSDFDIFNQQLIDMDKMNYKQKKMQLDFMDINSEIEKQKSNIVRNLMN